MEILLKLFENFLLLANAMSFYILLGLLIAGVLKQLIPADFISSHLGKSSLGSVIKATLFGIPMPVCSCSVIPLAKSLQKEGASKGAVQSFLISTPITGADSILATYSFFGWFFTLYRVVTSIIIAIITGWMQNYFDNKEKVSLVAEDEHCECSCSCSSQQETKNSFSVQKAFSYAYVTLFKDIASSLLVGLVLGALFSTFLPKELLSSLFEYQFLTYIAVLVIAMPLYVCATASLPIAGAFLLSGMSPGAAFVFLSAGPATNAVTMGVVMEMFGKKSLFIYLSTLAVSSLIFGYIFDKYFSNLEILQISESTEHLSYIDYISTTIMLMLILYYSIKKYYK